MSDSFPSPGDFLDAVAQRTSTPGGGTVAAAAGALACAMARMAAEYSPGRNATEESMLNAKQCLEQLTRLDDLLRGLMIEDAHAYAQLTQSAKRFRTDPTTEADYRVAQAVALRVPLEVAAAAATSLNVMERLALVTGQYLRSDLGVAAVLAEACVRAAGYMVRVNLASAPKDETSDRTASDLERLLTTSAAVLGQIESTLADSVQPTA